MTEEPIQNLRRRVAEAAVNRRNLDDRAARRDEPVEPLPRGESGDRSGGGVAGADAGHGFENSNNSNYRAEDTAKVQKFTEDFLARNLK